MKKVLFFVLALLILTGFSVSVSWSAEETLHDFNIYWFAYDQNYSQAQPTVAFLYSNLINEANSVGISINDIDVSFIDLDSGYYYPWLNDSIQTDLSNGLLYVFDNNDGHVVVKPNNPILDISNGAATGMDGYSWFYNDPRQAYVLSEETYTDDGDTIHEITHVFGAAYVVPLPSSLLLLASGVIGLFVRRKTKLHPIC